MSDLDWTAPPKDAPVQASPSTETWASLDDSHRGLGFCIYGVDKAHGSYRGNTRRVATNLSQKDAELIVGLYDKYGRDA